MRLEHIPLIIGAIVALIGLGFIADALMADSESPSTDRRRRVRAERSRAGEAIVGVGVLCMAAALFGRDTWRYGTLSVMVGTALILIGVIPNRTFLKEALFFRGPARRADPSDSPKGKPAARPARPAGRGASAPPTVPPRPNPASAAPTPAPRPVTARAPSPASPAPRPTAAATTPATPMRAVEPPAPKPAAPPPVGKVDRRKTPRGKK